ncbi:phage antirepressor KilAC domain-containing protein [Microbacterium dauci]|uniref:Phage antirepressor KilAC domain-containing protein n=1 Tax=Microbacterium dauci TaxID=3048008 RepID=A0ABT6ZAN1_9MICO|nr:phage antirepressor KilAC domain-containing protein [Microbacterium sp. LX3-4]MDJ1113210.1 phage antirepressor KilAC domain-containing protein [Microbacterium sp. LX3-4]
MTMVELQQPRTLIHRVDGRDLRVLVDRPYIYFARDDVETIATVPPWGTGDTLLTEADEHTIEISGVAYVPIDVALNRVRDDAKDRVKAHAFIAWVEEQRPTFTNPDILELAHQPASFASAYTVAGAAKALADELGIKLGRDRLFELMDSLGWIERNSETSNWMVTALPHNKDWLALRAITIGPRRTHAAGQQYLQIHVTQAGLVELARILRLQQPQPAPTPEPTPTLFD